MSDHDKAMEDYQKEQERQRRLYATAMSKLLPEPNILLSLRPNCKPAPTSPENEPAAII